MAITADNLKQVPLPKNTMVVAQESGKLYVVDFSEYPQLDDPTLVDWDISVSKLLIGKLQHTRNSMLTLEEIECENIVRTGQYPTGSTKDFQLTVFGSLDGKNTTPGVEPAMAEDSAGYIRAHCRLTAKNFQIQLRGTYNINTVTVTFHKAGGR